VSSPKSPETELYGLFSHLLLLSPVTGRDYYLLLPRKNFAILLETAKYFKEKL
jgi:hypothetical protein